MTQFFCSSRHSKRSCLLNFWKLSCEEKPSERMSSTAGTSFLPRTLSAGAEARWMAMPELWCPPAITHSSSSIPQPFWNGLRRELNHRVRQMSRCPARQFWQMNLWGGGSSKRNFGSFVHNPNREPRMWQFDQRKMIRLTSGFQQVTRQAVFRCPPRPWRSGKPARFLSCDRGKLISTVDLSSSSSCRRMVERRGGSNGIRSSNMALIRRTT